MAAAHSGRELRGGQTHRERRRSAFRGTAVSEAETASGEIVILPPVTPFIAINYGFILKRGRMIAPATRTFMKTLRKIESAIPK